MGRHEKHKKSERNEKVYDFIKKGFSVLFLCLIFGIAIVNFLGSQSQLSTALISSHENDIRNRIAVFETTFNENFWKRSFWVDTYGGVQRVLKKDEVNNFDVIRDNSGFLHMTVSEIPADTLKTYADNLQTVYEYCLSREIAFLYVQAPSDYIPGKTILPWHKEDFANKNIDQFLRMISDRGIPNLDTRDLIRDLSPKDIFYKTDHHWAMPASFRTFQNIIGEINIPFGSGSQLDTYQDLSHYTIKLYPNSFLGSRGIRTGAWYTGTDSFQIYLPNYETDFIHRYYIEDEQQWEKKGSFAEVFWDEELMADTSYNNKYNALMFGAAHESRIINTLAVDGQPKCLLISDSFGRQLVPYLSQCFRETAWIDPQSGRYNKSYLEYIREFQPDCVVVLFNGNDCYLEIPL